MKPPSDVSVAHITTVDISLRDLLLDQLLSLQEAGYKVTGISAPGDGVNALHEAHIRHIPITMTRRITPFQDMKSLWYLYSLLRRERFTIVHTHTLKAGLLGRIAARLARVPVIIHTHHGFYFHEHMSPLKKSLFILLEKIADSCTDMALSQNSEDLHVAIEKHICPQHKIRYLGNGINLSRFDPDCVTENQLQQRRKEFGLLSGHRVVGFVGRLVKEKGLLELFQAMQQVKKHIPEVRLLIIGPVDAEKSDALSPKVAFDYNVGDIAIFTGRRHDMPELYALMDVMVLPSHREGFPRSLMEASAMGIPCIATDIRGCREAVEQNRNGLLVPLGNTDKLAEAIVSVLENQDLAQKLGAAGRRLAKEKFDEQKVFAIVKAEYARLLARKFMLLS